MVKMMTDMQENHEQEQESTEKRRDVFGIIFSCSFIGIGIFLACSALNIDNMLFFGLALVASFFMAIGITGFADSVIPRVRGKRGVRGKHERTR
jgi:hypothetical protein